MKFLDEFHSAEGVEFYRQKIHELVSKPWRIMEICGGQTHTIMKNGLNTLLPPEVELIHGPGCPVCVTPAAVIDQATAIAQLDKVILCSYGDMLRVPGSEISLLDAKARGADVRMVYSPADAVELAKSNPGREVVFFAIGFETTAPGNGQAIVMASNSGLENFSVLASQVTVPAAMEFLLSSEGNAIDGFLAAGHVCTIMGYWQYLPIADKFNIPVVVTGFEPVDIMKGIYHCLLQLEQGEARVENAYTRVVSERGNQPAQHLLEEVFCIRDIEWRGIGSIPASGLAIADKYSAYDASRKFARASQGKADNDQCISGLVLQGIKKPDECPWFGKGCSPDTPMGATMVSEEGACAAYYQYSRE